MGDSGQNTELTNNPNPSSLYLKRMLWTHFAVAVEYDIVKDMAPITAMENSRFKHFFKSYTVPSQKYFYPEKYFSQNAVPNKRCKPIFTFHRVIYKIIDFVCKRCILFFCFFFKESLLLILKSDTMFQAHIKIFSIP